MNLRTMIGAVVGLGTLVAVALPAQAGTLRWTGEVDDTAIIRIQDRDVRTTSNLRGIRNARYDVRGGGIPNAPVRVSVNRDFGRGSIEVIEQPNPRNNFTAVIRIKDSQSGSGRYGFTLQWDDRRPGPGGRWDDRRDRKDRDDRWNDDRRDGRWDNGRP